MILDSIPVAWPMVDFDYSSDSWANKEALVGLMDFSNKSVLVTGGSRGIGQAIAVDFANNGARVAIVYRSNSEAAQTTLNQLSGSGHCLIQGDVSIADDDAGFMMNSQEIETALRHNIAMIVMIWNDSKHGLIK